MPSSPFSTFSTTSLRRPGGVAQPGEHPAGDGGADVQADHVVHFHGAQAGEAEAGAGLDGGVQVFGSADALVEDEGALARDGAHDPVDDEARHLLAHERGLLARLLHHALGQLVGGVGGLGAAMDLDQRDDVRGVEVVDADDGRRDWACPRPGSPPSCCRCCCR